MIRITNMYVNPKGISRKKTLLFHLQSINIDKTTNYSAQKKSH